MIKKHQIESILVQIDGTSINGQTFKKVGLLNEETSLSLKRRLRKIETELLQHWDQYKKDRFECEAKSQSEIDALDNEDVKIESEKVSMAEIEKIVSSFPYDFKLIELIAQ